MAKMADRALTPAVLHPLQNGVANLGRVYCFLSLDRETFWPLAVAQTPVFKSAQVLSLLAYVTTQQKLNLRLHSGRFLKGFLLEQGVQ